MVADVEWEEKEEKHRRKRRKRGKKRRGRHCKCIGTLPPICFSPPMPPISAKIQIPITAGYFSTFHSWGKIFDAHTLKEEITLVQFQ